MDDLVMGPFTSDEVVETSDPEEMNELPPLKRLKLFHSPTLSLHRSASQEPTSSIHATHLSDPLIDDETTTEPQRSDSVDPLLLRSPSIPAFKSSPPSSPLTPPPPDSPTIDDASRYPLRHRNPQQLNPYRFDQAIYRQTLRDNPEAIVKIRSPPRHPKSRADRYEEEEENAQPELDSRTPPPHVDILRVLPSMSSSSDEDDVSGNVGPRKRVLSTSEKVNHRGRRETRTPEKENSPPYSPPPAQAIMASPVASKTVLPWVDDNEHDGATSDSAIVIVEHDNVQQTVEEPQALSKKELKLKKQLRTLKRVYPAFMVQKLLEDASRPKRRIRRTTMSSSSESESEPPLEPGHSRVTKAKAPRERKPILGDPESENEKPDSKMSDSDVEIVSHRQRERKFPAPRRLTKSRRYELARNSRTAPSSRTVRSYDRYIIDWMLSNTAAIGSDGDLLVKEEDFTESVAHTTTSRAQQKRRQGPTLHSYFSRQELVHERQADDNDDEDVGQTIDLGRISERKRALKGKRASNGVYTLPAPDRRRLTGQRQVPIKQHRPISNEYGQPSLHGESQARRRVKTQPPRPRATSESLSGEDDHVFIDEQGEQSIVESDPENWSSQELVDFGISLVSAGTKFGPDTYVGKGFLLELVDPTATDNYPLPRICSLDEFHLGPHVTTHQLLDIMGPFCSRFFEFATGIPDSDNTKQEHQWSIVTRAMCHLVTHLLLVGEEVDALKTSVERHVHVLTAKLRDAALAADAIESSTFSICWFAVELAFRAGFRWDSVDGVFNQACAVAVECIVEYGFDRTMKPLVEQDSLSGTDTCHRALETLVSLWHLIPHGQRGSQSSHPIWTLVEGVVAKRRLSESCSVFESSERAWHAIISICTVSQFSAVGLVAADWAETEKMPRTCWSIVKSTLTQFVQDIRSNNENMSTVNDGYIKLVVERCCLLWSRWQWEFNGAATALNSLGNFLRTRMFANLANEETEFPDFLRLDEWSLLARPIHSETAFVLFLKLVYQTLLADRQQATKLLRSVVPLRTDVPISGNLSTLINRMSVLAIALEIQPVNRGDWIERATAYVNFQQADAATRLAYVRGFMYISVLMVKRKLDPAVGWLKEMMDVLLQELKIRPSGMDPKVYVLLLARALKNIIASSKEYPDVQLLEAFFTKDLPPALIEHEEDPGVLQLIQAMLDKRAELVYRPPRITEESQDDYGAIDVDVVEAFVAQDADKLARDEKALFQIVQRLRWPIWRRLEALFSKSDIIESFKSSDDTSKDVTSLAHSWVCCGRLLVEQSSGLAWSAFLRPYLNKSDDWDYFCQCRINLLVLYNVLQQDIDAYPLECLPIHLPLRDRFITVFVESLVSWYTTSEAAYINLLLSIPGHQHPLLRNMPPSFLVPDADSPKLDRLRARLTLVQALLENIVADGLLDYINTMFAYMRRTHTELEDGTEEKRAYATFCREVFEECEKHSGILLDQWTGWLLNL